MQSEETSTDSIMSGRGDSRIAQNTPNKSFWRSIHSLSHPLTIAAVLMLLFNDHWLRHNYPSWLTGKLGDFTWLIFAPLICVTLFAWIIPRRLKNHENIVAITSFTFIGLWFATAKTIPFIHAITKNTVEAIIGWQGTLRIDPTDLLTLPALLIGYYIWHTADNRSLNLRPVAWVILGLGIMGTLASDDAVYILTTDVFTCIDNEDDTLSIFFRNYYRSSGDSAYYHYDSDDGGLSWYLSETQRADMYEDVKSNCVTKELPLIGPNNPNTRYRYEPGETIERSTDGGTTWKEEHSLYELRQQVRWYYFYLRKERVISSVSIGTVYAYESDLYDIKPGPLDAIIHEPTGNVVFAMGWNGILVRKPDATWEWVGVDKFHLDNLYRLDKIKDFLSAEISLSITLCFLVVTTSTWYMRSPGLKTLFLGIGWFGWLYLIWTFVPMYIRQGYLPDTSWAYLPNLNISAWIAFLLLIFTAIPVTIGTIWDLLKNFRRYIPAIVGVGLITALLFLFPYVLWTQGTIPAYSTARGFALMLTGCSLLAAFTYLKRVLPFIPNQNKKRPQNSLPGYHDFFHPPDDDDDPIQPAS
jgi:hypothetical protein